MLRTAAVKSIAGLRQYGLYQGTARLLAGSALSTTDELLNQNQNLFPAETAAQAARAANANRPNPKLRNMPPMSPYALPKKP